MNDVIELSVVVPCYKKERIIQQDFREKLSVLEKMGITFEVIAVIDGKVDATEEKIKELNDNRISIISYKKNRGKGAAVREGIIHARGKYISYLDADMDINPEILRVMYDTVKKSNADIVYPDKFRKDSITQRTLLRNIYSLFYISLLKTVLKLPVTDTQTGAKLYQREVILNILPYCSVPHICFEVEIFSIARQLGYTHFVNVPVDTRHNDDSSMRISDGLRFLVDTYQVYRKSKRGMQDKLQTQNRDNA